MEKFNKLKDLLELVETDADKFYTNNISAAGTRVRKAMQEMKTLAQEIRAEVTDMKTKSKK